MDGWIQILCPDKTIMGRGKPEELETNAKKSSTNIDG
jgi:hypothetical protein